MTNLKKRIPANSVGLVSTKYFTPKKEDSFTFFSGNKIDSLTIAYETYGKLNNNKNNAILVTHPLSGTAHAAGFNDINDKNPGWWDQYIGPEKPFNTDKYFIICSNVIGGCDGSTGPTSINPETDKPYGLDFPMVTIRDMVNAQHLLIKELQIDKLLAVAGGSMGGMQALQWSILYPKMVDSIIAIATSASLSAQGIALNEVGRQAIINDPKWNMGNYDPEDPPAQGLSLARMIGHITYLSEKDMHERFGRKFQEKNSASYNFKDEFMVESYLKHQGDKFVDRFDANSYLYLTRALDYFDLASNNGKSLLASFENTKANFLIISFTTDWLYPSPMSKKVVQALRANGKNVVYTDLETDKGHDSFLLENDLLERNIKNFLKREFEKVNNNG